MEEKKKQKIAFQYTPEVESSSSINIIKEMFNEMIVECGRRCFSLQETEGSKITPAELICMNRCISKQITLERKIRQFINLPITDIPVVHLKDKTNTSSNPVV